MHREVIRPCFSSSMHDKSPINFLRQECPGRPDVYSTLSLRGAFSIANMCHKEMEWRLRTQLYFPYAGLRHWFRPLEV